MTAYVVDASVVVSYLLNQNPQITSFTKLLIAQALKKQVFLTSTPLLYLETMNALRYNLKTKSSATLALNKILHFPIQIHPLTSNQYLKILDLSYQNQTTIYDTAYHVLAISRNAIFLTCDQDYYKKAHGLGYIKLLK